MGKKGHKKTKFQPLVFDGMFAGLPTDPSKATCSYADMVCPKKPGFKGCVEMLTATPEPPSTLLDKSHPDTTPGGSSNGGAHPKCFTKRPTQSELHLEQQKGTVEHKVDAEEQPRLLEKTECLHKDNAACGMQNSSANMPTDLSVENLKGETCSTSQSTSKGGARNKRFTKRPAQFEVLLEMQKGPAEQKTEAEERQRLQEEKDCLQKDNAALQEEIWKLEQRIAEPSWFTEKELTSVKSELAKEQQECKQVTNELEFIRKQYQEVKAKSKQRWNAQKEVYEAEKIVFREEHRKTLGIDGILAEITEVNEETEEIKKETVEYSEKYANWNIEIYWDHRYIKTYIEELRKESAETRIDSQDLCFIHEKQLILHQKKLWCDELRNLKAMMFVMEGVELRKMIKNQEWEQVMSMINDFKTRQEAVYENIPDNLKLWYPDQTRNYFVQQKYYGLDDIDSDSESDQSEDDIDQPDEESDQSDYERDQSDDESDQSNDDSDQSDDDIDHEDEQPIQQRMCPRRRHG